MASLHKTTGPKWTVVTTLLVSLYRGEISAMREIDDFNRDQAMKAAQAEAAERNGRPIPTTKEDTEDFD